MSGTKLGGQHAAKTNKDKYGSDFYARIGSQGGRKLGVKKGFAAGEEGRRRARIYGALGGKKSRRGPAIKPDRYDLTPEDTEQDW
jgi:hypothetical protein